MEDHDIAQPIAIDIGDSAAQFSASGSMPMILAPAIDATAQVYQPKLAPTSTNRPGSADMILSANFKLAGS